MTAQFNQYSQNTLASVSKLRKEMSLADSFVLSTNTHSYMIQHLKAASYIWLCATLEAYLNNFCESINIQLNSLAVPSNSVIFSIFCLSQDTDFSKLYDIAKIEKYNIRSGILMSVFESHPLLIPESCLPLDGKTIRPSHLDLVWKIYGLPGEPFHNPVDSGLLTDLAEWRNKLAHGEETPIVFSNRKSFREIIRTIDSVNNLIEIMIIAREEYFSRRLYLR